MKLTPRDLAHLEAGARHPDGVINPVAGGRGFGKRNRDAMMARLVRAGLATPNAHDDWYITEAGRSLATAEKNRAR